MFLAMKRGEERRKTELEAWRSVPLRLYLYFIGAFSFFVGLLFFVLAWLTKGERKEMFSPSEQVIAAMAAVLCLAGVTVIYLSCRRWRKK